VSQVPGLISRDVIFGKHLTYLIRAHERYRQTDRQEAYYGNTALCTKAHRAVKRMMLLLLLALSYVRLPAHYYIAIYVSKLNYLFGHIGLGLYNYFSYNWRSMPMHAFGISVVRVSSNTCRMGFNSSISILVETNKSLQISRVENQFHTPLCKLY